MKMGTYTRIVSKFATPNDGTGIPIAKQAAMTAQIVIGTPRTIKNWISFEKLDPSGVKIVVFDGADQILAEVSEI